MKAVLILTYGTPASLDEVDTYYTHIRGGKRPSEDEINKLKMKYASIGGVSPLTQITRSISYKLLGLIERTSETKVYYAMKHSSPFIPDVMQKMYKEGIEHLLCLILAPHYSSMSVGTYMETINETNRKLGYLFNVEYIPSWYSHPLYISVWKRRIDEALNRLSRQAFVLFTAHSLPERILNIGDPYDAQLRDMAKILAVELKLQKWGFGYQSAGNTKEKWLGPDVLELLENLYRKGESSFVIAPIGFVSDHLEILYDIDVECVDWSKSHDVRLIRTELPNDSDDFIQCLYTLVKERGFA